MISWKEKSIPIQVISNSSAWIMSLGLDDVYQSIEVNKPSNIIPGVKMTLSSVGSEVLLEVFDPIVELMVGERPVIDVVQVDLGEVFYVNEEPYMVLSLLDVACPQKKSTSLKVLNEIFSTKGIWSILESEFSQVTETLDSDEKASESLSQVFKKLFLHKKMAYIAATVTVSIIVSIAVVIQGKGNEVSQSVPEKISTTQSVVDPKSATQAKENSEIPMDSSASLALDKSEPINQNPVVQPKKPKVNKRKMPSLKLRRAWRQQFNEISLEAKFNPEGAKVKLRSLQKKVPRYLRLANDIRISLSNL